MADRSARVFADGAVADSEFLLPPIENRGFPRLNADLGHDFATIAVGVVLPGFVIDALAETAKSKGRDDLLWPSARGGYLGPPSSTESWLSGAVSRCQQADPTFPRVTAHALRHTAASLAISAGANPKVVQRMLGHASAAMTLDVYADLFDSDLMSVADSVGKMWAKQSQTHKRSTRKQALPADTSLEMLSPLSGLKCARGLGDP